MKMKRAVIVAATVWYMAQQVGTRSGVIDDEVTRHFPGDDLVPHPRWQSTRAVTIEAPPEDVWPWIVQMGFPTHRAGWYTPPLLDRLIFGIRASSADRIRPDLQQLSIGDRVPDSDDWRVYFTVAQIDPPRALVLHSTRHLMTPIRTIDFSWAFVLRQAANGWTRLFIRARADYTPRWAAVFVTFVAGPADWVNASAMLRGVKVRVERVRGANSPRRPQHRPTRDRKSTSASVSAPLVRTR